MTRESRRIRAIREELDPRWSRAFGGLVVALVLAAPAHAGTTVVSAGVPGPSAAFSEVTVTADCGGRTVSGGGARLDQGAQASLANGLHIDGSVPLDGGRWLAAGGGGGAVPSDGLTVAYAVCLDAPPLATTVVVADASGPAGTFQETRATATCPPGTGLLSGGARATPGTVGSLKPRASYPSDAGGAPVLDGPAPNSWTAVGLNGGGGNQDNATHAYAVCAAGAPAVFVAHVQVPGPATASTAAQATASCPAGTVLLGGGASISDGFALPGSQGDHLTGSYPSTPTGTPVGAGAATAWTAATHTGGVDSGSLTQTDAWALCASEPEVGSPPPPASVAPANLAPPSITGAARAGTLLAAVPGRWSGSPTLSYDWLRCDTVCAPAGTGPRYRLTRADVGSRVRVRETAGATTVVSAPTGWIQGRPTTAEIKRELALRLAPRGKPGHIDTLVATGGITLPLKSLTAGRAEVRWRARGETIASGRHGFTDARTGTIRLRLTAAGRRVLRRADRVTVTAEATFTRRVKPPIAARRRFAVERGSDLAAHRATAPAAAHLAAAHLAAAAAAPPFTHLLGGTGNDAVRAIAVDRQGNTYVTGETASKDFPTTRGPGNRGVPISAFAAKLDRTGKLVYSVILGGTRYTSGRGIAVDRQGRAYIAGATNSTDFPTTRNAFQRSYGGGPFDAFVARLDPAGKLDYATFLGDTHYDDGNAVAVDAHNRAVVVGRTVSPGFPNVGDLQPHVAGGAFVAQFDARGRTLVYSTVFGGGDRGNHGNAAFAVALDRNGTAYVTGVTNATRFPHANAFQKRLNGGGDAFALAVDARRVLYSTYLGGAGDDVGRAIAVTPAGTAYVTGLSSGATFLAQIAARGRRLARWQTLEGAGGVGIALADGKPHVDAEAVIAGGPDGRIHRAANTNGDITITG
ncbi:SBBP repeat-containing protein [Solirubrobacter ginsenosidimutans]|uniref:SBBP repeat-containing protein n=1 Tax=Solirubrobacter ginsenosidimutans TaxID=490573 RepID=A0A9X3MSJ4_9ACTN|nr:SBBP repeat-containing protein [Solirubrobacter ginsenosidimutans]MDA0162261.1 SBBP repeat-containing protein [Solirubrobacter ginsenosidimutans]